MVIFLALPVMLALLGLVLPPPQRRPVGLMYWAVLLLDLLSLGGMVYLLFWVGLYGKPSPVFHRILATAAVAGVFLGVAANTAWGLGQAQRTPEAERPVAFGRIARRLWIPLVVLPLLPVALVLFLGF